MVGLAFTMGDPCPGRRSQWGKELVWLFWTCGGRSSMRGRNWEQSWWDFRVPCRVGDSWSRRAGGSSSEARAGRKYLEGITIQLSVLRFSQKQSMKIEIPQGEILVSWIDSLQVAGYSLQVAGYSIDIPSISSKVVEGPRTPKCQDGGCLDSCGAQWCDTWVSHI